MRSVCECPFYLEASTGATEVLCDACKVGDSSEYIFGDKTRNVLRVYHVNEADSQDTGTKTTRT